MPELFKIETQKKSEWCWAAVAVSIEKYFNPKSTLTQCEVAKEVLDAKNKECSDPEINLPASLTIALHQRGWLSGKMNSPLSFDLVRQEIDAGRPVCARIKWNGGGAHFIVLTGYEILQSGARHLDVADPLNPNTTVDYDAVRDNYYGEGQWVATYLVTNSAKNPVSTTGKENRYAVNKAGAAR
jgi:Papain-like cysteine protease AvrRpt2